MTPRTYLFVPGDAGPKLEKAWSRGADALIVDLEDAVPAASKESARRLVAEWLATQGRAPGEIWVRVDNRPESLERDVAVATGSPNIAGVVVPKAADAAQVGMVRAMLDESAAGPQCGLVPMIETARALIAVNAIAAVPGVTTLMLGEYDLAADLAITPDRQGTELLHARAAVVVACVAAGLRPPIGAVAADIADSVRFDETTRLLQRLGFYGRAVIHPAQVRIVNDAYTPDVADVAAARDTLARFDRALAGGEGVLLDAEGNMVDEATVRTARRTMEAAVAAGLA